MSGTKNKKQTTLDSLKAPLVIEKESFESLLVNSEDESAKSHLSEKESTKKQKKAKTASEKKSTTTTTKKSKKVDDDDDDDKVASSGSSSDPNNPGDDDDDNDDDDDGDDDKDAGDEKGDDDNKEKDADDDDDDDDDDDGDESKGSSFHKSQSSDTESVSSEESSTTSSSSSSSSSSSDSEATLKAKLKAKRKLREKKQAKVSKKSKKDDKKTEKKSASSSSKNLVETKKHVSSKSPSKHRHESTTATTTKKKVVAAAAPPSAVVVTATQIVESKPVRDEKKKKKESKATPVPTTAATEPVVSVPKHVPTSRVAGAVDLDSLMESAAKERSAVISDKELVAYMRKSPQHTAVILAAFLSEFVVLKQRPIVSRAVRSALDNGIAGALKNRVQFNPTVQKERMATLRSQTVTLCRENNLLVPVGKEAEDPLLRKKAIVEKDLLHQGETADSVGRQELKKRHAELEVKRAAAKAENATYAAALKAVKPEQRSLNEFHLQRLLIAEILSNVEIDNIVPWLPLASFENLSAFVINGGQPEPFFLDKKGYGDFFAPRLFSTMIKHGSLIPLVAGDNYPALCVFSLGHWLVSRLRATRNKKMPKGDKDATKKKEITLENNRLNMQITDFQETLFYNDSPQVKIEKMRVLYNVNEMPDPEWFSMRGNPIWVREATALPDRSKPIKKIGKKRKTAADTEEKDAAVDDDNDEDGDNDEEDEDNDDEDGGGDDDADDDDDGKTDKTPTKKVAPLATTPTPAPPPPPPPATKKRGGGKASAVESASREAIVGDRRRAPTDVAVEARVYPKLFFIDASNVAEVKMLPGKEIALFAGDRIDELAPTRTFNQAMQRFAVPTLEAHTTSAQTASSKNKKKKATKSGKSRRKRGDDDDDDDDDDDEDDDDEDDVSSGSDDSGNGRDEMALDSKRVAQPSEAEIDVISSLAHLEKTRVRHRFFEMAMPEVAEDINGDCPALGLKLDEQECKRFELAKKAMTIVSEVAVAHVTKSTKKPEHVVRFAILMILDAEMARSLGGGDGRISLTDLTPDAESFGLIREHFALWHDEHGSQPVKVDKTRTVKKATITRESQRVHKPARGTLTTAGSLLDGTSKVTSAPAKAWLMRKMQSKAIDVTAPLTTHDIKAIVERIVADGKIDGATMARVLLDESLSLAYVMLAMDKKLDTGALVDSDVDISNLPLFGRLVVAPGTGFVSYIANCMILNHALSTLGSFFRESKYTSAAIKAMEAAILPLLPKESFTPFVNWLPTETDKSVVVSDEAKRLAATMLAALPPALPQVD